MTDRLRLVPTIISFEVNKFMSFDREATFGYHLDIPSGTSIRFEAKENKKQYNWSHLRKPCDLRFEQFNKWPN